MGKPLVPHGGNDIVYTPDDLALRIVQYFRPFEGRILEPCEGGGAFTRAFKILGMTWDACEIQTGCDFLQHKFVGPRYEWVITNPPWSQLRPFLQKSMEVSNNVVFLCLVNAFFMRARVRDIDTAGFALKEILYVNTPPKPWPQTGFQLGAVHIQRDYKGLVKIG